MHCPLIIAAYAWYSFVVPWEQLERSLDVEAWLRSLGLDENAGALPAGVDHRRLRRHHALVPI